MEAAAIVKTIESGDFKLLMLMAGIAIIQFLLSLIVGERTKNSIKNEYDTNLEKFKNELIKKKFIYESQIEAYREFCEIVYKIYPEKYCKDMDYADAVVSVAESFTEHYKTIERYLHSHAGILPEPIKKEVESCWHICSNGKLEVSCQETTNEGYDLAEELWKSTELIAEKFRTHLGIDKEIKANN